MEHNTMELGAGALATILIGIIAWLGKKVYDKISDVDDRVIRLEEWRRNKFEGGRGREESFRQHGENGNGDGYLD